LEKDGGFFDFLVGGILGGSTINDAMQTKEKFKFERQL
jgi:hypothetical protein